jgi:hypothetical protein
MSGRMNWRAARLRGRPSLDVNRELEVLSQDGAARWLAATDRRQQKNRTTIARSSSTHGHAERSGPSGSTRSSVAQ